MPSNVSSSFALRNRSLHDEAYYYGLRTIARKDTLGLLNKRITKDGGASVWDGTELASITDEAIEYAEGEWRKFYADTDDSHLGFNRAWSSIWYHTNLQPSNFNLAIWQTFNGHKVLQGLAVGRTSEGKEHLTLNWVERNFGPEYHRFGILIPTLMCLERYAELLGCEKVLIKNPVDPSKYTRYGYKPFTVRKSITDFLAKEIPNG